MAKGKMNPSSSSSEHGGIYSNSQYEKPVKPRHIQDKTGWEVRPENKMILGGSKQAKKGGK